MTDARTRIPAETRDLNFHDIDGGFRRLLARRDPDILLRHGARLSEFGAWVGGPLDRQAAHTDRFAPPRLETYDRQGRRVGRAVCNDAYDACHREAYRRGAVGLAFGDPPAAPHLVCFAMGYLLSQADISIHCPVTMTGAVAHVLDRLAPPGVRDRFLPDLVRMDGGTVSGGTWATELHGGSDVGATTTRAEPAAGTADGIDGGWRLHGLKWFASNAGSNLALATARPVGAPEGGKGLGCYLVPSHLPDGTPNRYFVRRLKDKLGTRGLATGEIDLEGAWAVEVAPPPFGLKAMMEALEYSRVHNAMGAAGIERRAFLESVVWAVHREAFGGPILRHPMVLDGLFDRLTELEADTALAVEAARAFDAAVLDRADADGEGRQWLRLVTALAKYRTAEQAVRAATRAVELVGGNGYTEEFVTARLYRDSLVTAVWEGPANIQALEVLRLMTGRRSADRLFLDRLDRCLQALPAQAGRLADALAEVVTSCRAAFAHVRGDPGDGPRVARRLLDLMADALCLALLCEAAADDLADGAERGAVLADRFARRCFGAHPCFGGRRPVGPDPGPPEAVARSVVLDAAVAERRR